MGSSPDCNCLRAFVFDAGHPLYSIAGFACKHIRSLAILHIEFVFQYQPEGVVYLKPTGLSHYNLYPLLHDSHEWFLVLLCGTAKRGGPRRKAGFLHYGILLG